MEKLFTPDFGLMAWTVLTFGLLLVILGKFGWRPLIEAIEAREQRLKADREAAEAARAEAQRIQADLEAKLADIEIKSKQVMTQVAKDAEAFRAKHAAEAQDESRRILDKARGDLEIEKQKLVHELRKEVASLSVLAAEKLMRKTVDSGVQKSVLDGFFKDLDSSKAGSN